MAQSPLPWPRAALEVGRCVVRSTALLVGRRVHRPRAWVGRRVRFADGSIGRVYRETIVAAALTEPCVLDVCFRLRLVRGGGHRLFEWESLLNTPLFVGFPGFATKLWVAHDENDLYRGLYEWDGAERATAYARALWRVLQLVSVPGSIDYHVLPGRRRADFFAPVDGEIPDAIERGGGAEDREGAWWEVVEVA
jgi:hypothetical protein